MSFPLPPGWPNIYPGTAGGITPPTLNDWQMQYGGLTFGAGTNYGVNNVEGLGGLGTINSQDQPFPRDTGEYVGVDAPGGRDITIDMWIQGTSGIYQAMVTVGSAMSSSAINPQPLWFKLPGLPLLCSMCRPRTRNGTWDSEVSAGGVWKPQITLHANDPRLYTAGQASAVDASGVVIADGVTFPVQQFNLGPLFTTVSESLTLNNTGNTEMRPILVLDNQSGSQPMANPVITNSTIGSDAKIQLVSGATIAAGDVMTIDLGTPHTVVYWTGGIDSGDSVVSAYNLIDRTNSTWWNLLPGNNSIDFAASNSPAQGNLTVLWASAYTF